MTKPTRIQLSRKLGWRLPPNTVKVDRTTKFGNPYPMLGDRAACVAAFRHWLETSLPGQEIAELARKELRGKSLGCWCGLDVPCHADVLLKIANR
jgi:hypothetical protein